jgi:hypothetical protein
MKSYCDRNRDQLGRKILRRGERYIAQAVDDQRRHNRHGEYTAKVMNDARHRPAAKDQKRQRALQLGAYRTDEDNQNGFDQWKNKIIYPPS